jgi:glycosyltransferase involved in cell wall biosynthesis
MMPGHETGVRGVVYVNPAPPVPLGSDVDSSRMKLYGPRLKWLAPTKEAATQAGHVEAVFLGDVYPNDFDYLLGRIFPVLRIKKVSMLIERLRNTEELEGLVPVVGCHHVAHEMARQGATFIFDPTDSHALFYRRRFDALVWTDIKKKINSLRLHLTYRSLERRIARGAAAFVIRGTADETYVQRLVPQARVVRLELGTDLIHAPPVSDASDGSTIGFHGGMGWEPNRMTAERLASSIAPRLAKRSPSPITMKIAGRPVSPRLARHAGRDRVVICGYVPDLREWMASLTLYVMPMYSGAGMKTKLIEALAMGMPVVTNELGVESLKPDARHVLVVVRDDEELVEKVLELLGDHRRLAALRVAARAYAVSNFDWTFSQQRFMSLLDDVRTENARVLPPSA